MYPCWGKEGYGQVKSRHWIRNGGAYWSDWFVDLPLSGIRCVLCHEKIDPTEYSTGRRTGEPLASWCFVDRQVRGHVRQIRQQYNKERKTWDIAALRFKVDIYIFMQMENNLRTHIYSFGRCESFVPASALFRINSRSFVGSSSRELLTIGNKQVLY